LSLLADELENGIECCARYTVTVRCSISVEITAWGKLRVDSAEGYQTADDTEESEDDEHHTALFTLRVSPTLANRAYDYTHGNNGPEPYSDGYEAMEVFQEAKE